MHSNTCICTSTARTFTCYCSTTLNNFSTRLYLWPSSHLGLILWWLDKHMIAQATHLVDYSGIHEAWNFSSKWWLRWNLPLRTQGQRPESQVVCVCTCQTHQFIPCRSVLLEFGVTLWAVCCSRFLSFLLMSTARCLIPDGAGQTVSLW